MNHTGLQFHADPNGQPALCWNGQVLGFRPHLILRRPCLPDALVSLRLQADVLIAELPGVFIYQECLHPRANILQAKISLNILTDAPFAIHAPLISSKPDIPPYFCIPGFIYGTNNRATSTGQQPKFAYGGAVGWPVSSRFLIRADRSTHRSVLRVSEGVVLGVWIDERMAGGSVRPTQNPWLPGHFYNGLLLDTSHEWNNQMGFQLGYENAPKRHGWWHDTPCTPRQHEYLNGYLEGMGGCTLHADGGYVANAAPRLADWSRALNAIYPIIHEPPRPRTTRAEALQTIGSAMVTHGYNRRDRIFELASNADGAVGDIAWTGGMQVAWPLLLAGHRVGNRSFTDTATDFADHLCAKSLNLEAGLMNEEFRDGAWQVTGWWGVRESCCNFGDAPLHSAYLNGQAAYFLLKSHRLQPEKPAWLKVARQVIETALRSQRPDGTFGMFFDPRNGEAVDYDGFQGCWLAAAAACLGRITREPRFLHAARRALDAYHAWYLRGELYGTPMDTHRAVDEEGNLAFLALCSELEQAEPGTVPIQAWMDAAAWEFSFKFAYNTAFTNEPLRGMGWTSCGGSITSTHHNSIHQMGNLAAADLHRLALLTSDDLIHSRVRDTRLWGLNTHNRHDGEFGFGFAGQATEQFFYTDGIVTNTGTLCPWDGGIWDVALPWASACCLLSAADDAGWQPGE